MLQILFALLAVLSPVPRELREWQRERAMRFATLQAFIGNPLYGKADVSGRPDIGPAEDAVLKKISADPELSAVVFAVLMLDGFVFDLSGIENRGNFNRFDDLTEVERYYVLWHCNHCVNDWNAKKAAMAELKRRRAKE